MQRLIDAEVKYMSEVCQPTLRGTQHMRGILAQWSQAFCTKNIIRELNKCFFKQKIVLYIDILAL